jgi:hypothetical protein
MDIQEMIDSRIRKLRAQDESPVASRDDIDKPDEVRHQHEPDEVRHQHEPDEVRHRHEPDEVRHQHEPVTQESHRYNRRLSDREPMPMPAESEFGDFIDKRLSQLAMRMLEIGERMSADYGRLEQDLLRSRLEVLQGAEEVVDLALSLRKQCRRLLSGEERYAGGAGKGRKAPLPDGIRSLEGEDPDKRVGMHSMGVADLFRRT